MPSSRLRNWGWILSVAACTDATGMPLANVLRHADVGSADGGSVDAKSADGESADGENADGKTDGGSVDGKSADGESTDGESAHDATSPIVIDACTTNAAGIGSADVQRLKAGGAAGALRFLYPYSNTVFPRGLSAPSVMWDGVAGATAVYLHMHSDHFDYQSCTKPSADSQVTLPDDVWARAGAQTLGASDPFTLELSVLANGAVTGPIQSSWTIAQATLSPTSLGVDEARASYVTTAAGLVANAGIPAGALMPMFSPDGTLLIFNDYAIDQAHGLALMDYDHAKNTATHYRVLFKDTSLRPAWPFVLPDNHGAVFTRTDASKSDVYLVDFASQTVTLLAQAMGYLTPDAANANQTYLPFGAEELHSSYFPTLSAVATGGYFWMFFDAVRHYGNLGMQRQLWAAAIDIAPDGSYAIDRSHPAFYVPNPGTHTRREAP